MLRAIHLVSAVTATAALAVFFAASLLVGLAGSSAAIAAVKAWIVTPGMLVFAPALAATAFSGLVLARGRKPSAQGKAKSVRMAVVVGNGLFVLLPCALILDRLAQGGAIGLAFQGWQALELAAGFVNLWLMESNLRAGRSLAGRLRAGEG